MVSFKCNQKNMVSFNKIKTNKTTSGYKLQMDLTEITHVNN